MKRLCILLFILVQVPTYLQAQGEGNIWMFKSSPHFYHKGIIDFTTPTPTVLYPLPGQYNVSAYHCFPVAYPNGQLRFSVEFSTSTYFADSSNKIRDANGNFIPDTDLNIGTLPNLLTFGLDFPIIIPHPGNSDRYYIFYTYQNALTCSLLDMGLNNGVGGIVSGEKDIRLTPLGSVYANAMTAVKGCDGVWLVARSRIANEYYSFHVGLSGLDTSKIVSVCGSMPINDQLSYGVARMCASPEGSHLAVTSLWKGIEIYDFEKCSGKVKNARIIDDITADNTFPNPIAYYDRVNFASGGFSPDGSKFYATRNETVDTFIYDPNTGTTIVAFGFNGQLFQYDLSQPTLALTIASKTLVLTNQPAIVPDLFGCYLRNMALGDVKLAPNGRIYIDNGSTTCYMANNIPPGTNPVGFHAIDQPNLAGLACQPVYNEIVIPNISAIYGAQENPSFARGIGEPRACYLPPDIVVAPPPPDTLPGTVYNPIACFSDSMVLTADIDGSCYLWDDSSTQRIRTVHQSGTYYVKYFKDCDYITDTFHANMIHIPAVLPAEQSCPGMYQGVLIAEVDKQDSSALNFIWKTADSSIIRQHTGRYGDTIHGLDTGHYFLQITTATGCDTTIRAEVTALPKSEVAAGPVDTIVRYGDSITLYASGTLLYIWFPVGSLDSATKASPIARPLEPTLYSVVGINQFGCRDTGYVRVDIDYSMPDFVPNAFSPNGDGLNDVFSISNITYQKVIQFRIFNRYGQEIFSTQDGHKGWDGKQNDKPCDVGTYFYLIQLDYPNGKRKTYKGDVSLLR